jgi:hypothetical protein
MKKKGSTQLFIGFFVFALLLFGISLLFNFGSNSGDVLSSPKGDGTDGGGGEQGSAPRCDGFGREGTEKLPIENGTELLFQYACLRPNLVGEGIVFYREKYNSPNEDNYDFSVFLEWRDWDCEEEDENEKCVFVPCKTDPGCENGNQYCYDGIINSCSKVGEVKGESCFKVIGTRACTSGYCIDGVNCKPS